MGESGGCSGRQDGGPDRHRHHRGICGAVRRGLAYYKTLADVPEWYRGTVQKAVDKGALNGTGDGELNVSEDLCRTLTVLNRMGNLE